MTPQERQLVDDLFQRLATLEREPRDPEAERAIREGLSRAPNAVYALVQTTLLQDEALRQAHERIAELEAHADHDPLTGVLNRRGFDRELARAAAHVDRYGGRLVLVYLDLDGFKPINDRHGHAAGDAVLRAVAGVLRGHVRASDLVARLGGDEFVVLLWNLGDADAAAKAASLEAMIAAARVPWEGATVAVGASAGLTVVAGPTDTAAALARADAAMYAR
ncbi:GGDEF domain-containing protein, partial [Rhodoplanes serenus]|uniref:GGDEF domain-containing protein n=1 Tax=Rhodoplanes serenus TaxID=200615 RepID=UPI000DABC1BE